MDTKIDLHRFSEQIEGLIKGLRENPPQKGGVLLYGSSTMGNWRADDMCYRQLEPFPIVNTGFGGATAEEALYYYHDLVVPAAPSVMVYYEGANDLFNGYTPEQVIEMSHRLFEWCRQDFSGIQFVIMPVKLCPGMKDILESGKVCNRMFEEYAEAHKDTHYLNVDSLLYDESGEMRTDIYVEDLLHHNEKGYVELAGLVKPVLSGLYKV